MLDQLAKERIMIKQIREKFSTITKPGVSIITPTNKRKYIHNIFNNYARLEYTCKELIIILNSNELNEEDYKSKSIALKNVRIFQLDESYTLGQCLNFGIEHSRYNYISKMDDDDYYCANYLVDLMNVFAYTDAQITGKMSSFVYFEDSNALYIREPNNQFRYVDVITGSTILAKKEIFQKIQFQHLIVGEDSRFLIDCQSAGIKIYAADKFNYVCMRHKNLQEHTWRMSSEDLMSISEKFLITTDLLPIITV